MASVDQVWEALESQETFCAWEASSSDSFKRELETFSRYRKAKLSETDNMEVPDDQEDEDDRPVHVSAGSSRFYPPEYFRRLCMKNHVDISNGNFKSAQGLMMKAEEIFNSCLDGKFIGREYEEGYRYVGRSLQIYFSLSKEGESWDGNKVTDSVNFLKSYDKLCDKSKAAVLSVKSYFYRNIYADSYEEQIVACKQLCNLDNENPDWHVHLYCTLSQERIKNNTEEFSTFADEIAAITAAVECPRARNEPFVMSCYMSCLAQKLNQQVRSGALFPMSFGSKVFQEEKHVVEFIRSEAERVMAINPTDSSCCTCFRRIFCEILPAKWRDFKFALVCAKRNQIFFPESGTGNYGLAAMNIEMGDFDKGEEYLLKAHQADKRDFWGILDLLYLWLGNASSNRAKFDKMFDDYVKSPWHANNKGLMASLHLVKGIQLCVLNDYDGAAEYFLGAFRNDASRTLQDLKDLPLRAQVYRLDELKTLISSEDLRELFRRFAYESRRSWSFSDRKTFRHPSEGTPANIFPEYTRQVSKELEVVSTEGEALTVLNLESEVHAAYQRAVKSCNPENFWTLSDEELHEHVEKMGKINKAWEVLYMPFIQFSSRQ